MSKQSVNQVIQRAIGDAAFRRQLQRDPSGALAGFDLTKDEQAAITSGDPTRLTALGVDQRMSKAFGLGAMTDVSKSVIGDTGGAGSAAFLDEGSSAGTAGLVGQDASDSGTAALISDDATVGNAAFTGSDASGNAVIVGDPAAASIGSSTLMAPDGTSIDAGFVSGGAASTSAFEPASAAGDGTASFDAGAPTGSELGVAADLDATSSVQDAGTSVDPDVHPTEY